MITEHNETSKHLPRQRFFLDCAWSLIPSASVDDWVCQRRLRSAVMAPPLDFKVEVGRGLNRKSPFLIEWKRRFSLQPSFPDNMESDFVGRLWLQPLSPPSHPSERGEGVAVRGLAGRISNLSYANTSEPAGRDGLAWLLHLILRGGWEGIIS